MSKDSAIEFIRDEWHKNKVRMKDDNYEFDTLEEAAEHYSLLGHVLREFSMDLFQKCRYFELRKGMCLTRVVNEATCNVERIIPKKEYCNANRMNPKGKFYGYYVIDYNNQERENRIKTGIKEIRAEHAKEVSSCEFTLNTNLKLAKLAPDIGIKLTLDDDTLQEDCYKIKRYYNIHGGVKGKREIGEIYTFNILIQTMIAGDFFCPVEGTEEEKNFHYAPFRLIAEYLDRNGYDGILYQSSVDPNGYCVVIFQPDNVIALEQTILCNINVSDILNK